MGAMHGCVRGMVGVVLGMGSPAWAAEIDGPADTLLEGNVAHAAFGSRMAAGDITGDGIDDLVVQDKTPGRAYEYHGTADGLSTSRVSTIPISTGINSELAGLVLCDVDGDGHADLLSQEHEESSQEYLRVRIWFGTPDGLQTLEGWRWESTHSYFVAPPQVACADLDGDGLNDLLIGEPGATVTAGPRAGRLLVFDGHTTGPGTVPDQIIAGTQADGRFGFVAALGDVDADGHEDILASAPYFTNGQNEEGRAYFYRGRANGLSANPARTFESNQYQAHLGSAMTSGDYDGDAHRDATLSAPVWDGGATWEGAAWTWMGSLAGLPTTAAWSAEGNLPGVLFGAHLASLDRNGDGYDDLVVAAPGNPFGVTNFIEVYPGGPDGLDPYPNEHFTPPGGPDWLMYGDGLATGDFNGDGAGDIAIGAPFQTAGEAEEGIVGVWNGTPPPQDEGEGENSLGQNLVASGGGGAAFGDEEAGLGCTTTGLAPSAWLALGALAGLRRRR